MKAVEFCYWLQGYFEIDAADRPAVFEEGLRDDTEWSLSAPQVAMIKKHLALVFLHDIDPSYPKEQQDQLNEIHSGIIPAKPQVFRC